MPRRSVASLPRLAESGTWQSTSGHASVFMAGFTACDVGEEGEEEQ